MIKFVKEDQDFALFEFMVTPFGSKERKDLHGEYFSEETDFGEAVGLDKAPKLTVLDHLLDPSVDYPDSILGFAHFKHVDGGRWFEIQLSKAHKYYEYIKRLVEMGIMGTSSQAYNGGVKHHKDEPGHIVLWLENELTWTVQPASPDTLEAYRQLRKQYNLPDIDLPTPTNHEISRLSSEMGQESLGTGVSDEPQSEDFEIKLSNDLASVKHQIDVLTPKVEEVSLALSEGLEKINEALSATNVLIEKNEASIKSAIIELANYIKLLKQQEIIASIERESSEANRAVATIQKGLGDQVGKLTKLPDFAPGS